MHRAVAPLGIAVVAAVSHWATPPCAEHAPWRDVPEYIDPSLHFACCVAVAAAELFRAVVVEGGVDVLGAAGFAADGAAFFCGAGPFDAGLCARSDKGALASKASATTSGNLRVFTCPPRVDANRSAADWRRRATRVRGRYCVVSANDEITRPARITRLAWTASNFRSGYGATRRWILLAGYETTEDRERSRRIDLLAVALHHRAAEILFVRHDYLGR